MKRLEMKNAECGNRRFNVVNAECEMSYIASRHSAFNIHNS